MTGWRRATSRAANALLRSLFTAATPDPERGNVYDVEARTRGGGRVYV